MKFARIVNGRALDVVEAQNLDALSTMFAPEWLANQTFIEVPSNTENNAVDNGDGTYTNPPAPAKPSVPKSATTFMDHCYKELGKIASADDATEEEIQIAGITRFGAIMKAARASTADAVTAVIERYDAADSFSKSAATVFIDILVSNSIADITTEERNAIINGW